MVAHIPDRSIRICADRGGTFCDVHASYPDPENPQERKELVVKLLSQDPDNYKDAPTEGIRRVLETLTGESIPRGQKLNTDKIDFIRLSTTVATNALLERKGQKHALLITKGFKDLLAIGNQSRPKIFDLNIRRAPPLYQAVLEVDERVTLVGYTSDPKAADHAVQFDDAGKVTKSYSGEGWIEAEDGASARGEIVQGLSGEAVQILKKPDHDQIKKDLQALYDEGYRSLAVVLVHSYTFPHHELAIGKLASSLGFTHISLSSQLLPMIKMLPRGVSSTADAYLTPILMEYVDGFFAGFDAQLREGSVGSGVVETGDGDTKRASRVEFMGSDGGLVDLRNFSGLKSILSGPAGGVVGYALTSWDDNRKVPIIGIDVGGTSTDVSRYDGRYELVYETTTAGITVSSPQLDINTVAAGGGSCLAFRNGLFVAGPESAGANPGPACYKKGGPLAVTDANLVLGRLIPDFFPKIFGKHENEPLDRKASIQAFEKVREEINRGRREEGAQELGLEEVAYGFIKVANETMCRPIRSLTEAKGHALAKHVLASFGGAGGQHATEIARLLGIKRILIHRHSSILSAYGLALADRAFELQEPASETYSSSSLPKLLSRLDALSQSVKHQLIHEQGFAEERIVLERLLNMRFDGTDTALMVLQEGDGVEAAGFEEAFKRMYRSEFGFVLEGKAIIVDDVKVRGIGKTFDTLGVSVWDEIETLETRTVPFHASTSTSTSENSPASTEKHTTTHSVYFEECSGRVDAPVYRLEDLERGDKVKGPAIVIDATQTIVLDPRSEAVVTEQHLFITLE
ncbi:5-oxoprolinase [Clavulina sp. PMI_390]|nr:5-oxoprolinase [Clavulina sp. PMI_390]